MEDYLEFALFKKGTYLSQTHSPPFETNFKFKRDFINYVRKITFWMLLFYFNL